MRAVKRSPRLTLLTTADEVRSFRSMALEPVVFVPTMGALHDGHLSLVDIAHRTGKTCFVSIFVNALQFGPNEDFAAYPRTLPEDLDLLERAGVDAVFVPEAQEIYQQSPQTFVHNPSLEHDLCGLTRPGHFRGVLTVVLNLFHIVQPEYAIFGRKDYQQLKMIERMVQDLNLRLTVVAGPTIRCEDGLAMSSRNRYLSNEQRLQASSLYRALSCTRDALQQGTRTKTELQKIFNVHLNQGLTLEYLEFRSAIDLSPASDPLDSGPTILLVAARLGAVRLIDNLELVL